MINIINYPPQIEKKLSAFVVEDSDVVKINVPYILNKALTFDSFNKMYIIIKTTTTSQPKWTGSTVECKMYSNLFHSYYASFTIPKNEFTPVAGNYYKIQIAFENDTQQSKLSTVGVIKCTYAPTLKIDSLINEIDNISPNLFVGVYENKDSTEKVYSYKFTIYNEQNEIFETSDEIIHNGTNDEIIVGIGVRATMQWKPKKEMAQYVRYRINISITTINNYIKTTAPYVIKAVSTVDANIPAKLLVTPDYDNGCIHLSLIKPYAQAKEEAFSGSFLISRYSENLDTWDEICRFNMLSQTPSEMGILWTDYTIEHGVKYIYALQAYNSKHLYSNKIYQVVANPDPYGSKSYLEYDEFGKPLTVMGDFEDMFLTDSTRQLKIRFNPQVSSYKPTILESKIDTIGGQYPFIFRNGNVNYKEFSISGLLSYTGDEKELFMTGIKPEEDTITRSKTPAAAGTQSRKEWLNAPTAGTHLTSENFYRERQFKTEALEWLTNGEPKLFRSAGEGNFIVRLMNVSLSPNDTLGRMIHTFSATAYEIDELTFENLKKYNLLYLPEENNSVMKFTEVNLNAHSVNGIYSPGHNMYHVSITNASPYTRYALRFNELAENSEVIYEIGLTGCLYLDSDMYPVTSIKKESGDDAGYAILRYGYYDTAIPDNFNDIASITIKDEAAQILGFNFDNNIIATVLNDKRRQVGRFYSLIIKPRNIVSVRQDGLNYYNIKTNEKVDIHKVHTTIYEIINGTTKKYYYYADNEYITSNTLPSMKFKLNQYVIDLAKTNKWSRSSWVTPFIEYTQGSYRIECDLGEIKELYLSPGVYAELCYELKEIEYAIEDKEPEIKALRSLWKEAIDNYVKTNEDYDNIKITYNAYISKLTEKLEENNYVI